MALSGLGELLGALFDVNHPGHGLAFALGVPSWPVGVLLAGIPLARRDGRRIIAWISHAPWLSLLIMAGSFGLLASSAAKAGVVLEPGKPWHEIPTGVIAWMGWANRLLVIAYLAWTAVVARHLALSPER